MRHGYGNIYIYKGILYLSNGTRYDGEWKCNTKSGKGLSQIIVGTLYYLNNEKYEGEWKDDVRCGEGNNFLY